MESVSRDAGSSSIMAYTLYDESSSIAMAHALYNEDSLSTTACTSYNEDAFDIIAPAPTMETAITTAMAIAMAHTSHNQINKHRQKSKDKNHKQNDANKRVKVTLHNFQQAKLCEMKKISQHLLMLNLEKILV